MDNIILKKNELNKLKNKYENKIFLIKNELIKYEQEIGKFSEEQLVNSLKLSNKQREIVEAIDDNILVIACPGAGKTHTLISRYVNLVLKHNIKPETILLITFTKKAGQEMLHRLEDIIPSKLPFHVGSLHGLSYRILQNFNNINYTVLDEKETKDLLNQETNIIINQETIDDDDISLIKSKINCIIDQVSTNYPINFKNILQKHKLTKYYKIINNIYKSFNKRKKQENAIDFNDLMIQFCDFLKSVKGSEFINKIKYIFFDEYQDINPIQNFILNMFQNKSKIMVVGDDAQSIYSFRGSSVKYIYNYSIGTKYFLVENYRSSTSIVNFCQNIIEKNLKQFDKKVSSGQIEIGLKPSIYGFKSITKKLSGQEEQYKWIVQDIIKKIANNIPLSNIVILARTNRALASIELELIANKIHVVKQLGIALLDKYHIKDFIAFIIIITNPKSSIHWKRIISLHKGFGMIKANEIVENCINIYDKILTLSYDNEELNNLLIIIDIINNTINDFEKAKIILNYLEKLWLYKRSNIEEYRYDILTLLNYLKNSNLKGFINDLYLNQEIETLYDNALYLSTIHGAKGLEWEHVYLMDVNNNDFPNNQTTYYIDELETMEEERRLFYVACSRAKKFLTITYHTDEKTDMSLFIRELDCKLYFSNNVIKNELQLENNISKDITNVLRNIGYTNIAIFFEKINNNNKSLHSQFNIPNSVNKLKNKFIIGKFTNYLIFKMIQNNFPNKIKKFESNILHKNELFSKTIYHEYIDNHTHWNNLLNNIFYTSTYLVNSIAIETYKNFLLNNDLFYKELEVGIRKLVDMFKPKEIYTNYCLNFDLLKANIDLLFDDILIEIKVSSNEICNIQTLCQAFTHGYLMTKKNIKINKIVLYNVESGVINIIDTSVFDFKLFYEKLYFN
jgi:DNA helicase-2/ATP-dependent DNA helicase PcrA